MFVRVCVCAQAHVCVYSKQPKTVQAAHFSEIFRKEKEEERKPNANSHVVSDLCLTPDPKATPISTTHWWIWHVLRGLTLWNDAQEPLHGQQVKRRNPMWIHSSFFNCILTDENTRRCKQMEQSDSVWDDNISPRVNTESDTLLQNVLLFVISNTKIGKKKYFSLRFAARHWLIAAAGIGCLSFSVAADLDLKWIQLFLLMNWPGKVSWANYNNNKNTSLTLNISTSSICM